MYKIGLKNAVLSAVSAVLVSIPFLIRQSWLLSFFSLVPLLFALKKSTPSVAFRLGTITGALSYFITTYWLIDTITVFGGFPLVISLIFHLIISIYSGLFFGIFSYLLVKVGFPGKSLVSKLIIGIIWVTIEYYYPLLFPFSIANPLANFYPIIQASDLVGINYYSFVLIFFNLTFYNIICELRSGQRIDYKGLAALLIFSVSIILYGYYRINTLDSQIEKAQKLKVAIVQGNFDFTEKKVNNYLVMDNEYKRLSEELNRKPDLTIWPETAIQVFIPTDSSLLEYEHNLLIPNGTGSYFLSGGLSYQIIDRNKPLNDENIRKYNSAFLTDENGVILGRFHKIKLLLFGEYLPFSDYFPSIKKISPATGDYVPGKELNLLSIDKYNVKIGTLICYEDIIPSFARHFKQKGANLLVNLTNDAWFGQTIAPFQHLLIALPRSVENRTYLIRSTNTGVSAIIDPVGRILRESDIFKQETIESTVGIMNQNSTFFSSYGYMIYPLSLILSLAFIGYRLVLRRNSSR